ncbi:MAG: LysR family transcriptional regulator [Proteobacteria bacterium]|nr:LysR family transcriptional regulator [Pseudomonadota bacterium]
MDFRWLQDFLSLAEVSNFTEAAATRHSSQPAFSRRIQQLESWLGVELIDRSCYPTRLTPAGERFRRTAADIIQQMVDARAVVHGEPALGHEVITFALPHSLAISRFPEWWKTWHEVTGASGCRLLASNVHDAVTAHVAGAADVLLVFHHAQQPIFLDPDHYDRIAIASEWFRPYVAVKRGEPAFKLPGTAKHPFPLINYSPNTFMGRMVDLIMQSAPNPVHAFKACESDLASAIHNLIVGGHGIGWLPESAAAEAVAEGKIKAAGDNRWSVPFTIFAFCDRSRSGPAVQRLMAHLRKSPVVFLADGKKPAALASGSRS